MARLTFLVWRILTHPRPGPHLLPRGRTFRHREIYHRKLLITPPTVYRQTILAIPLAHKDTGQADKASVVGDHRALVPRVSAVVVDRASVEVRKVSAVGRVSAGAHKAFLEAHKASVEAHKAMVAVHKVSVTDKALAPVRLGPSLAHILTPHLRKRR
jgi:hypothetical protein